MSEELPKCVKCGLTLEQDAHEFGFRDHAFISPTSRGLSAEECLTVIGDLVGKACDEDVIMAVERAFEKKEAVTRNTAVLETAIHLMRVCYDEANRLANHCKDGAARWAMGNLYRAANDAKAGLWDSVESAGLAHTDSVFRNPNPSLSEHDGQPESASGASSPKDLSGASNG